MGILFDTQALYADSEGTSAVSVGTESKALEGLRELDTRRQLESLHRAELGMFPALGSTTKKAVVHLEPPPALTSVAAESPRLQVPARLEWLQGIASPDLPVRWREQVVKYLEYFRNDPRGHALMRAWVQRSTRYDQVIRTALRERRLPEDLRCVALAESGFDPSVRSSAGAVGLWQFVAPTAKEYSLRIDHWADERLDPYRSTAAAARYLADLHQRFGAWEPALAAYNMGYGALLRSMRKYNTNDYWVLSQLEGGLPFETTVYVAKILACAIVLRNLDRFAFHGVAFDAPVQATAVPVGGGLSLKRIARVAKVDVDSLSTLNPALRRGRTPPGGTYLVRVPASEAAAIQRVSTRLRPKKPATQPYQVRLGDNIELIARRYRTTPEALRTLNDMADGEPAAMTTILVPKVSPLKDEPLSSKPVVGVPDETFHYADRRQVFFRCDGRTRMDDIVDFFRVTKEEVGRWNLIDPHAALHQGLILQLFAPRDIDLKQAHVLKSDQVRVLKVGSEEFLDHRERAQGRVRFRYRVRSGDSLSSLAKRFGLSVGSIARINRFPRSTELKVDQEIVLYADPAVVPSDVLREWTDADPASQGMME